MNFGSNNFSISAQPSSDQKTQGGKLSDTSEIILIFIHRSLVRSPVKTSASQEILICGRIFCVTVVSSFLFVKKMFHCSEAFGLHVNGEKGSKFNPIALHQDILNVTNSTLSGGSFI